MMQVPLVLVSNNINGHKQNRPAWLEDAAPRQDYIEIAQSLGGELCGNDLFDTRWYHWTRRLEKRLKLDFVEALYAVAQTSRHNFVLSTSEKIAVPLAALFSVTKREIPHIVIGHKLSSGLKTHLLQAWALHKRFSQMICVCQAQADYAVNRLGMPQTKVNFIYDKVDHHFFRPQAPDANDYILAVGQEQRDYPTLLRAVAGTGLKVVVVASSPWSTSQIKLEYIEKVTVLSHIPYQKLRNLYAGARLVVVPLLKVDYAAGVNTLLEAMAMAKPVVVSHTKGIADYVSQGETGQYVPPEDPQALRDTILSLWERPEELKRLGANARQVVEERMNLDIYIDNVVRIVHKALENHRNQEIRD
jgi:glycosyltransferase involved in cell wall biosynthesis